MNNLKKFEKFNESKQEDKRNLEIWNAYMGVVDGLDGIISELGELPTNYFKDEVVKKMDNITTNRNIANISDVSNNIEDIKSNAINIIEPLRAYISSGKISEDKYFKAGVINKLDMLVKKDIVGLKN